MQKGNTAEALKCKINPIYSNLLSLYSYITATEHKAINVQSLSQLHHSKIFAKFFVTLKR
jgi:hypothetical protein